MATERLEPRLAAKQFNYHNTGTFNVEVTGIVLLQCPSRSELKREREKKIIIVLANHFMIYIHQRIMHHLLSGGLYHRRNGILSLVHGKSTSLPRRWYNVNGAGEMQVYCPALEIHCGVGNQK